MQNAVRHRSRRHSMPFPRALEQHLVSKPIAAGGMATVHLAVSSDPAQQALALKRLHPYLAEDPYFGQMLLDEAAIASCVRHPNVVTTYGADMIDGEIVLVMEYVPGLTLHVLMQKLGPSGMPARLAAAIVAGALRGLHAAHEAVDASGRPLRIVHRDVSPQNILLGLDGVARVLDFGIATADRRSQPTRTGELKGKLSYMAPEQLREASVDRRTDVYGAAVVLWEALVGAPLFHGVSDGSTLARVLEGNVTRPGSLVGGIPARLDAIVMRGVAERSTDRFATALDMATALDAVFASEPVDPSELAGWIQELGAETLQRLERVPADLRGRSRSSIESRAALPTLPSALEPVTAARVTAARVMAAPANAARVMAVPLTPAPLMVPPAASLRDMARAFREALAVLAVIFVTSMACGLFTELAVADALGHSRTSHEIDRGK